jgi:NADH-quinone oxidoreductase subunit C
MSLDEVRLLLIDKFGDDVVIAVDTSGMQGSIQIKPQLIAEVCLELRDNQKTYFDFLSCLTGVDYGVDENRFGVVYHLASIPYQTQLTLKVSIEHNRDSGQLPSFPTVSRVYKTAEWHEREAYDLIGIYFENHPDLRRILLPDDWEGYPLRKNYSTEGAYYKGLSID